MKEYARKWQAVYKRIIALLAVALYSIVLSPTVHSVKLPSANRECATCHIMWLSEFKRKDVTTLIPYDPQPGVDTGKQDISSTEEMCFSCHDGFVLDSRDQWGKDKHAHPVGIELTKGMQLLPVKGKQILPLNDDNKIYCGTCHTAHGVDWGQKEQPLFMRMESRNGKLCLTCHSDKKNKENNQNHAYNKKIKHKPPSLIEAGAKFGHDTTIVCQSCHQMHAADNDKIMVVDNKSSDLCVACHREQAPVVGSKHDMAIMVPKNKNMSGQTSGQSGPCSACHIAHGAKNEPLWAINEKQKKLTASSRCVSCHNAKGIAKEKLVDVDHGHPINVDIKKSGIKTTAKKWVSSLMPAAEQPVLTPLPLYDESGHHAKKDGNVSCGTCHDPHVWSANKTRKTKQTDVRKIEGGPQDSFLRLAHDDKGSLCVNCHVEKAGIISSEHNLALSLDKAVNSRHQTTSQSGLCGSCHLTHNTKNNLMWAGSTRHSKTIDAMCEDCHSENGIASDKQTGIHSHPTQMKISDAMNKKLPLFKGTRRSQSPDAQVSCASCHDPHQWDSSHRNYVARLDPESEGDASNSFLRISAAGPSALCVNCHQTQASVIKTDHDLSVTAPDARNNHEQTVAHSGVCGQCHAVHNAQTEQPLWARTLINEDDESDPVSALCISCHNKTEHALAQLPEKYLHPESVQVWSNSLRPASQGKLTKLPVFDKTQQTSDVGNITCVSCHDPHQWRPGIAKQGSGKNLEGDTTSSFLRLRHTELFVCADCHGQDALFRYKYFHTESSRTKYPLYR